MRALGASRTSLVPGGVLAGPWVRDGLWRRARAVPSLDLRFADNKSLVDAVTGASLVTFTRASSGTFVDSAGVLQTAAADEPRFDHNPITGESLGLLVEEQRTNLLLRSGNFSIGFQHQRTVRTANADVSPDGTTNATLVVPTTDAGSHSSFVATIAITPSIAYAYSIFVKPSGYSHIQLAFTSGFNNLNAWANFSLTGSGSVASSGTSQSASIQALANGWYRCVIIATSGASATTGGPAVAVLDSDRASRDPSFAGNAIDGAYFWGADLQAGAFPTSYIPTTTAAVTRNADVVSITGSAFSGWYRQDEGTVFVSFSAVEGPSEAVGYPFAISDNTINNRFTVFITGPSNTNYRLVIGGTSFNPTSPPAGSRVNIRTAIAGKVGTDQGVGCVNGLLGTSSSPASMPLVDRMYIGAAHSGGDLSAVRIRRLTYWPQRLANSTLQTLTQ